MSVTQNLLNFKSKLPQTVTLVAVSKTHSAEKILEAYKAGQRIFGENKVQELVSKQEQLPKDIEWHLIGHLQTNKVKFIAPFVSLIHSVDSLKLLQEINKQAVKNNRTINCLLQIYIASEETKFGLSFEEATALLNSEEFKKLQNIKITGLMGMASNTENSEQVKKEFRELKNFFNSINKSHTIISSRQIVGTTFATINEQTNNDKRLTDNCQLTTLSMGMSSDYETAIAEGSTM
ncbi:MAG: YggS family pyridoxal phosphate-dependent enzyme, partial [Bacteroidia bacterium]|nr:YggS family pyridoxal phosphate-dependent enzyme [Bacteroidia bacterium]